MCDFMISDSLEHRRGHCNAIFDSDHPSVYSHFNTAKSKEAFELPFSLNSNAIVFCFRFLHCAEEDLQPHLKRIQEKVGYEPPII